MVEGAAAAVAQILTLLLLMVALALVVAVSPAAGTVTRVLAPTIAPYLVLTSTR